MTELPTYEFGDVRVDLRRMAVYRGEEPVALEPKSLDILRHLLEHRDRLVSKDELLDAEWKDTFVTPNVLTRAIAQLRKGLGDDAREARYIETVSKRGYRFIAPVTVGGHPEQVEHPDHLGHGHAGPSRLGTTAGNPRHEALPEVREATPGPGARGGAAYPGVAAGVLVIGTLIGAALWWSTPTSPGPAAAAAPLTPSRLTTRLGNNATPAISHDGRAVAYASDQSGALEICVVGVAPGSKEIAITADGGQNMQPAWSPDGQLIAFHSRKRGGIWVVPSTGGTPRQLVAAGSQPSWSPDGRRLAYAADEGASGSGQGALWTMGRDGADRRQLTHLGDPPGGHSSPAWSRNGKFVVFAVSDGLHHTAIWITSADGGTPRRLFDAYNCGNPEFGPDDRSLYWSAAASQTETNMRVYRVAIDQATFTTAGGPAPILPFDDSLMIDGLSIAEDGTLVVGALQPDTNLWIVELDERGNPSEPQRLTAETVRAGVPAFSRDGRIAYTQMGNGRPVATWIMNGDGTNAEPLLSGQSSVNPMWSPDAKRIMVTPEEGTFWWVDVATRMRTKAAIAGTDIRNARLSPDGRELVFHVIEPTGVMNVWAQPLDGGPRRRITSDAEAACYPAWSPDGQWIAVELKRGERTHIGVVSRDGGPIEQLTDDRGQSWPHSWSPDGEQIVFAAERDGIWNLQSVVRRTRATRALTHFTSPSGYVRYPSWSTIGRRIVFERSTRVGTVWSVKTR